MQKQTAIGATCKDPPKENAKTDDMFLLRKCTLAKTMQKQTPIGATGKDHLCCTKTMQKQTAIGATCKDPIQRQTAIGPLVNIINIAVDVPAT